MEKRVTARTKARARAARPISEAPTTEAPSGRAELSATGRVFTLVAELEPDDGWSVGNRFAALPPGLSVGPAPVPVPVSVEIPGRLPMFRGDVLVIGDMVVTGVADVVGDADADGVGNWDAAGDVDVAGVTVPEIWTVADAAGSSGRLAALPTTVNLTDFTVDAAAGTADSAWSWRCADVASIAPRSHDAVPSSLPQPKLNFGATLDGVACSRRIASLRLPPVVQALTTHWMVAPRSLLDSEGVISTQRSTWEAVSACASVRAFAVALEAVLEGDGLCFGCGELDGLAFEEALGQALPLALFCGVVLAEALGDLDGLAVVVD